MTKLYRLTINFTSDDPVTTWDIGGTAAPAFLALALDDMDPATVTSFKLERVGQVMPDCEIVDIWPVEDQAEILRASTAQ